MKLHAFTLLALAACGGTDEPCSPDAPDTICTIVGTGESGFGGDLGPALEAKIYAVQDSTISPDGELWLLDFNNYRVRAVDSAGIIRTTVGNGLLGESPAVGEERTPAATAFFNHTTSLEFHDGYLYLAAWHNSRVKRVRLSDMSLENFAGLGTRVLYAGDDGPAAMANLDLPSSVTVGPAGELFVMDQANQVIRSIGTDGMIHRIAGKCVVEDAPMSCATPVACPNSNKTTCGDPAIQCFLACTPGYYGDTGSALDARIAQPFGQAADPAGRIAFMPNGDLVFADTDNNRIRVVSNGTITTLVGTGVAGYSGEDGPAVDAQIDHPVDVAVSPEGEVYFTDVKNNCIRKVAGGIVSRVAGLCGPELGGFAGDGGSPLDAKLNRPYGIDIVGTKLYISDSYNHRIRVANL
jgi:hypothetical protein